MNMTMKIMMIALANFQRPKGTNQEVWAAVMEETVEKMTTEEIMNFTMIEEGIYTHTMSRALDHLGGEDGVWGTVL